MLYYNIVSVLFLLFVWYPCMAINVSVQYNGGLLPDIILFVCLLKLTRDVTISNLTNVSPENE